MLCDDTLTWRPIVNDGGGLSGLTGLGQTEELVAYPNELTVRTKGV